MHARTHAHTIQPMLRLVKTITDKHPFISDVVMLFSTLDNYFLFSFLLENTSSRNKKTGVHHNKLCRMYLSVIIEKKKTDSGPVVTHLCFTVRITMRCTSASLYTLLWFIHNTAKPYVKKLISRNN